MSRNVKINGIALAGLVLLGTTFSSFASSPEEKKVEKSSNMEMKVQVVNQNGEIVLTDVVAENDPILQYNMENLPEGVYDIEVIQGERVINTTSVVRKPSRNGVTVEFYNSRGQIVMSKTGTAGNLSYDLEGFPKGEYNIIIYNGEEIVNKAKIKN